MPLFVNWINPPLLVALHVGTFDLRLNVVNQSQWPCRWGS